MDNNNKLPVRCLILDHDDTTVNSSPEVNYPAFVYIMEKLRPGVEYSYDSFVDACSDPGFVPYARETLGFTDEEMKWEAENWLRFSRETVPTVFPGLERLVMRCRQAGIILCVVSHSWEQIIVRDWQAGFGMLPDGIYDWNHSSGKRKPDPFPVFDIMERFGLSPDEIVVADDSVSGAEMARLAGVRFVGVGWAHQAPRVKAKLRDGADGQKTFYFTSPAELEELIFNE